MKAIRTMISRAKTTVLAVVVALILVGAPAAFAANGDPWILGKANNVTKAITSLGGELGVNGPMLRIANNNAGANATALNLRVKSGHAPMRVNSNTRVDNLNADSVDGKDFGVFNAEEVIDARGPLPLTDTFTSKGGTLVISVAGSGFRDSTKARTAGAIGMLISVDNTVTQRVAEVTTNERDSHKAFVGKDLVFEGLPAGQHTIMLKALFGLDCNTVNEDRFDNCTSTDDSDYFNVTVIELPG